MYLAGKPKLMQKSPKTLTHCKKTCILLKKVKGETTEMTNFASKCAKIIMRVSTLLNINLQKLFQLSTMVGCRI